ncbi:ribulokinase [Saliterribacillus persicus]|uniref:Ribulokinase n=1 Tax=Saliterribacillus persicus TaxID=930114 RepID=A0A368Y916_9BACI|nr:ribulokinase [Saliterribacillus persicus]RCW76760.1 L-ribulokinase [Saliterribacillus persicus]
MVNKYVIGVDYGTESGRAVLVSLKDGSEIADHVTPYFHGVIEKKLPNSEVNLGYDWALEHAADYIEVLTNSIPAVMKESGVDPDDVIGLGIDFTACTMLPVDENRVPLMFDSKWKDNPHSWVKLWKHHAAQRHANQMNEVAAKRNEDFLPRYGGKISSEWMIAKVWETLEEAPEIYDAADKFVEATDWVVSQLSGTLVRNSCTAGYKSMWHKQKGYPSKGYFKALDSRLEDVMETKLRGDVVAIGTKAGELTAEMANAIGLREGVAIAVGNVDAHVSVPAVGVTTPGKMVMTMGTSICHLVLSEEEKEVEGMCGVVEDGILPGMYGYEAGQSAVGDIFAWFVDQAVPGYVKDSAKQEGINVHQFLEREASKYRPGETGLIALDWWNGNRSVLVDTELSGLIIGTTLQTKPEEIYRTLLEATAFGTRKVIDAFENNGVAVEELYVCGGLPQKNALLMQIYADVTNRTIKIAASKQTPALGAAMFGAVAAGTKAGGFDTITDAAKAMARVKKEVIKPNPENVAIYEKLYQEYAKLHDYFGRGENNVMKRLKAIRLEG